MSFDFGIDRGLKRRRRLFNVKCWVVFSAFFLDISNEFFRFSLLEIFEV